MSTYHTNETGCVVSQSHITGDIVCQQPGPDCDCLIVAEQAPTYFVIEATPGYLPDADEPAEFDEYSDAVAYANERADELEATGYFIVDRSWASRDNGYAIHCERNDTVAPDLGRTIEVVRSDNL